MSLLWYVPVRHSPHIHQVWQIWQACSTGILRLKYTRLFVGSSIIGERKLLTPFIRDSKLPLLFHRDLINRASHSTFPLSIVNRSHRLSVFAAEFSKDFNHPAVPPLPRILATISSSMSKQTENHFYACFVKTKELIATFQDVIIWLLKRDLLVALHLRVRVVVPPDLKVRVRLQRERALAQKNAMLCTGDRRGSRVHDELDPQELDGLTAFPNLGLPWLTKQVNNLLPSAGSNRSGLLIDDEDESHDHHDYKDESGQESESDMSGSSWDAEDDHRSSSIISDPARATSMQRRWLSAMSEGKDFYVAKQFEQWVTPSYLFMKIVNADGSRINQYFDGKHSDDEILYRAEISRKQLREVLHHYAEYVSSISILYHIPHPKTSSKRFSIPRDV